ncbi:zinc-binding alcohol dehydrogenase family protein [Martelella mangrovi]|uniref:Zinc-type alcohol dehydrogenase-like protein n=1 Tax=Martelella mangrovi TaxID=1397477 RepID=A0ABV2IAJ4_9HYPH
MRAIGYEYPLPISDPQALIETDVADPVAGDHDLIVEIKAISVNPVDVKIRASRPAPEGGPAVIGWDAAGIVRETGRKVTLFNPGDRVFYAGAIDRPGTNAQFHAVDERIVGKMPETLSFAEAAALPLTAITAYEAQFDRLQVANPVAGAANAILIIGGAGGVASIAIQLARQLTDLQVIATASRPETEDWVRRMGAHHVINHRNPLSEEIAALGTGAPGFVFSTNGSDHHAGEIAKLIAPQGRLALIDDPAQFDIMPFKLKAVSAHWETMFTRSLYGTPDMIEQHRLLNAVADLVDDGKITTTLSENLGRMTAETMKNAHARIESGSTIGKIVLDGF